MNNISPEVNSSTDGTPIKKTRRLRVKTSYVGRKPESVSIWVAPSLSESEKSVLMEAKDDLVPTGIRLAPQLGSFGLKAKEGDQEDRRILVLLEDPYEDVVTWDVAKLGKAKNEAQVPLTPKAAVTQSFSLNTVEAIAAGLLEASLEDSDVQYE